MVQHMSEAEAVSAAFQHMRAVLDGSAVGKLKQVSEKVGTLAAVTALAVAPGRSAERTQLADTVAEFLVSYYKDEVNEEASCLPEARCQFSAHEGLSEVLPFLAAQS